MSGFQDIKAKARENLHGHLSRPAMLHRDSADAEPVAVTARYHSEHKLVGDLAGTNLSYAETAERPAQIVFWGAELSAFDLNRGQYVVFSATEGYFIDNVHPADGLTVKADVTPLRAAELVGLTTPGGDVIAAP